MAGGTAVLGGLVAGPALAVLGVIMDAKASKILKLHTQIWQKLMSLKKK